MPVTAKSLREKVASIKSADGKHDPTARVSLPVGDIIYLANQLDILDGNSELSPATEKRLKREGSKEFQDEVKKRLDSLRCAIASLIAKAEIQNLRTAFVANAVLELVEDAWWSSNGTSGAMSLIESTSKMLKAMDRLQEMAHWQLIPTLENKPVQLARPISTLDLSSRVVNALNAEEIFTVGDLIQRRIYELKRIPSLGQKSLNEIIEVIKSIGLFLTE